MALVDLIDQTAMDAGPLTGNDYTLGLRLEPDGTYQPVVETVHNFLSGIHTAVPNFPDDFQDPVLFYDTDSSELHLTFLHRGVSRDLSTIINIPSGGGGAPTGGGGQSAAQVAAAITAGIASGVEAWARTGNAALIPLLKLDLTALEQWADRQDLLPKDQETLLTPRPVIFGHSSSQTLHFDRGKTRPTTGTMHFDIQGNVVQVDAAALDAAMGGTIGQSLAEVSGVGIVVPNAISSNEDGNYDVSLRVAKDDDSDALVFIQISGSTNLNRRLGITATADISFLTDLNFDAPSNRISASKRSGDDTGTDAFTLPAYLSTVAYNATNHTITITARDGSNTTTTTINLPAATTPVTPDVDLEPPDEFYDEQLSARSSNFVSDSGATQIPLQGSFDVWVNAFNETTEIIRDDAFTFEALREKTASANGRTPTTANAISGTADSGAFWIGRTTGNRPLFSNRGDNTARRFQLVSHYAIKPEPPTTFFDESITVNATTRNIYQSDPGANAYSAATDGTVRWFVNDVQLESVTPRQVANFGTVQAGTMHTGGGIEDTRYGTLGFTGTHFVFAPINDAGQAPDGTVLRIRVTGTPVQYVRTNALDDLIGAFLAAHNGITYSVSTKTFSLALNESDLSADLQRKIDAVPPAVQQFAQDTTTLVPQNKLPFITWHNAANQTQLQDNTIVGPAGFNITAAFTYDGTAYRVGDQLIKTGNNQFHRITDVTQGDITALRNQLANARQFSAGRRFPTSPTDNAVFLLNVEGSPGTYTNESGTEGTTGAHSGDIFQYNATTSKWTRIFTAYTYRPIPSATIGNTDTFPTGSGGKVVFERAATDEALPARAMRPANSIILDARGRPYVNLGEAQRGLAYVDEVVTIGGQAFPAPQKYAGGGGITARFQVIRHATPTPVYKQAHFENWTNPARLNAQGQPTGRSQGAAYAVGAIVNGQRQPIASPLHRLKYYSRDYYDATYAGRFELQFFGDSGSDFGPHTLVAYPSDSTNPARDTQRMALVQDGVYWLTAAQVPEAFRPESGTRDPHEQTFQFDVVNGDGNYLYATEEALEPRYVESEDLSLFTEPVQLWEANGTEIALIRANQDNWWNTSKQNENSWIHINDIPQGNIFMEIGLAGGGRNYTILPTPSLTFPGRVFHQMYRVGDRRPGHESNDGGQGNYGLNPRPVLEIYSGGVPNWSTDGQMNCIRFNIQGIGFGWLGISVHDSRLSISVDHTDDWGPGSKLRMFKV